MDILRAVGKAERRHVDRWIMGVVELVVPLLHHPIYTPVG